MNLTDVEHQRHPFELADGKLAQPLFVEQRERAHTDAVLVEQRHLLDDELGPLRIAIEHDNRGIGFLHEVANRGRVRAGGNCVSGIQNRDHSTRSFGRFLELCRKAQAVLGHPDHQRPVGARCPPVVPRRERG
jgi:hypothetical protein